jgi:hypothetical protein
MNGYIKEDPHIYKIDTGVFERPRQKVSFTVIPSKRTPLIGERDQVEQANYTTVVGKFQEVGVEVAPGNRNGKVILKNPQDLEKAMQALEWPEEVQTSVMKSLESDIRWREEQRTKCQ